MIRPEPTDGESSKRYSAVAAIAFAIALGTCNAAPIPIVNPNWAQISGEVHTDLSIQVCAEPPLRNESPIKRPLFESLRSFKANYARIQFWHPYPKLSVAQLEPPAGRETYWDFRLIDPIVDSFYHAAEGRPIMVNFSTLPQWMYKTETKVSYPANPNTIAWHYNEGVELRDSSLSEIREYYKRLASWYVLGAFVDEFGKRHESGHRLKIDYWEVLNEIDLEHDILPELYTRIYDEVVGAVKEVSPQTKFSGLALANPADNPAYFEYFLDPKNHKPNIPLDMISYHFYATPESDESPTIQQFTLFRQADAFASTVRYIESIRKRLSPQTKTYLNEIGTTTAHQFSDKEVIPSTYWHLSGAVFAYLYIQLMNLQIDLVAGSELIDFPGQVAGSSLSDWNTGLPNARFQVLNLLRRNIHPGDKLVDDRPDVSTGLPEQRHDYSAQGMISPDGTRKILIVNKRNRRLSLNVIGSLNGRMEYTDVNTAAHAPVSVTLRTQDVVLGGFSVSVITLTN